MCSPRLLTFVFCCFCLGIFSEVLAEDSYEQHKNIVYAETDGVGLVLDVFVPKGTRNGYGVVDVASGAWHSDRSKIRDHKNAQIYEQMAQKGFVVFAVRPGSITKFKGAEMLSNLRKGIAWVKDHADEYEIKSEQLGLIGASAGGHLASLAAVTADEKTAVAAVAVFFPPTDLVEYAPKSGGNSQSFQRVELVTRKLAFGMSQDGERTPEELEKALKDLSPVYHVTEAAPPFLLIHGDADPAVPLEQSQKLQDRLQEKGVAVELIVKPGGGHPWPTIHEEVAILANWLEKQLVEKEN